MQHRAYAVLHVKSADGDRRVISGVATTPTPDRVEDIIEPLGVQFKNPLPLLLYHDATKPVGQVRFLEPTADGIRFEAHIPKVFEPGIVQERTDEAFHSAKYGLMRGASIGFRAIEGAVERLKSGGLHFKRCEVFELSLVTIPANAEATVDTVKSLCQSLETPDPAALGTGSAAPHTPGGSGSPVVRPSWPTRPGRTMKPLNDQITGFEHTRAAKQAELEAIQTKAVDEGRGKDQAEREAFQTLKSEIKAIDDELVDLRELQELQKNAAVPVAGHSPAAASSARAAEPFAVARVQPNEALGIGFTRAVMCKAASFLAITKDGHMKSALDFARERYPDNDRLHAYLKATINAGTTTDVSWAAPLVYNTNLVDEFIEFLRPQTILGKFGQNGIPSLTRTPFNVRVPRQTSGGDAYWVGQGAPKPLTKFDFDTVTLGAAKVAAISVITEELARMSSPSAETRVRDGLAGAVTQRIDIDFIDPAQAAVANVNPASITNGLTAMTPSGTTADAARSDFARIIAAYLANNQDPSNLVIIMPTSLGLSLSVMVNSLGQPEFSGLSMAGGRVVGLPVITSQYAANQSGGGNLVIAVNAKEILLADDGQVTVDVSREASLQMLDNPTNASAPATPTTLVSMFQTNSLAIRAERFINWAKARSTAVVYMDDVNWGSIGSPT